VIVREDDRIRAVVSDIGSDLDKMIAESLRDPDLSAESADYRRGYERGFREAFAAGLAAMIRSATDGHSR
jgi:hypothetical protein